MALTLDESAKLSQDQLSRGVIEMFVLESVILDRLPLMPVEGNAFTYNEEATLPGVSFRAVNEAYPESTGTVNQKTERLFILGGDADVDAFIAQTRSNLNDQRTTQTHMKVKAAVRRFQDTFFNGDTSDEPREFDGLRRRLTGAQVINAGGIGPLSGGNDFFDALDALTAQVRGLTGGNGALFMNAALIAKVKSSFRRLGNGEMLAEDIAGKRVPMWNGIPLLDPGERADGSDILPLTAGAEGPPAGEIYAVRFGESEADAGVTGLTNGGIQVKNLGEIAEKPVYRTRIEFYCGMALFGGRAAARLTSVANS